MDRILSPMALWQDFDAAAHPLETNIIEQTENGGIVTQRIYFTGVALDSGEKVRVYAVVCYKNTASQKPAVLLVNSPSQPIDEEELAFWATNGMVAMSIDYNGESTARHYTIYPQSIPYANYTAYPTGDFDISGNTAKETKWYYYIANSKRAITYLLSLGFVKFVSVLSVGEGSKISLAVMTDSCVKCGSVVYGNINIPNPYETDDEDDAKVTADSDDDEVHTQLAESEKAQIWEIGLSPQSYLPLITAPVYYVCGGNSKAVNVESFSNAVTRANADSRLLILPDTLDYLPNDATSGLIRWLKGNTAVVSDLHLVSMDSKTSPVFCLTTSQDAQSLSVWYCRQPSVNGNNWVRAQLVPTEQQGVYQATADVYVADSTVYAVAVCEGDVTVSTGLVAAKSDGNDVKTPSFVLYGGENDSPFISINNDNGKWHGQEYSLNRCKGYLGIYGIKGKSMGTFAIRDSSIRHVESDAVTFDICCDVRQTLYVITVHDFGGDNQTYCAKVQLIGDSKWQHITLSTENFFRVTDGHGMSQDMTADMLVFKADEKFILNNVMLV